MLAKLPDCVGNVHPGTLYDPHHAPYRLLVQVLIGLGFSGMPPDQGIPIACGEAHGLRIAQPKSLNEFVDIQTLINRQGLFFAVSCNPNV